MLTPIANYSWLESLAPRIQVVFCDLDDTLLDICHRVPTRTASVVRRLQATGVRFAPATGRTVAALHELFGDLLPEIDYVAGNGTDVMARGSVIYHEPYPRQDAQFLFEAIKASPTRYGFVAFDERGSHLAAPEADFVRAHIETLRDAPVCADDQLFAGSDLGKVGIVAVDGAPDALAELETIANGRFTFAPTGPHWIDVLVRDIDKAQGIARFLNHLGLTPDEALAFGDSMNDLAMMQALPHTVAVSNAMPAIIEACAYTIGSNRDEAVLDCLDHLSCLRERLHR